MSYNSHASANIRNSTPVTLKSVTLHHRYSDDSAESQTWTNVAPGATTSSMSVGFNTGFIRTGQDYWWAEYTLPDGSVWAAPGDTVKETLHSGDKGETRTLQIEGPYLKTWRGDTLHLKLQSGDGYNNWVVIQLKNDFPVNASVLMTHKYSSDTAYTHQFPDLAPGATCAADDGFIVYYNTGFIRTGSDHWGVDVQLNIPPYDNSPGTAFASFSNSDKDKGCMLYASDSGKAQVFQVDGKYFTMAEGSGSCTDNWKTWNGYNTLAFIQMKNDFSLPIKTCVLEHAYSSDTTWSQTRGMIPAGEKSGMLVAEYNTGFIRTGSDHWTVRAYLTDGNWYENKKPGKGCMLRSKDATTVSTFSVSTTTFEMDMASGKCTDSMNDRGTFSPTMGRDVNKRYDENAYVGSHNAYANFAEGFWYAQQFESIRTQLGLGATTLLLDIWYDDGDIYFKHEDKGILQPFVENQKLSTGLKTIKEFLTLSNSDPVTIVFEDRVPAAYQSLVQKAFQDSDTWSMVFNPDSHNVNSNGWPTLSELFRLRTPIVVLTSNRSSPYFAYQWNYMSENVYGDESLDEATWLNKRSESRPLNNLSLCALNHFPTWSVAGFKLTSWVQHLKKENSETILKKMVDECHTQYSRYPNYINADFWDTPAANGVVDTIVYMNNLLHGTTPNLVRVQDNCAILTEYDHSKLLRGNWNQECQWVERNFELLCPAVDELDVDSDTTTLEDFINLTLVLGILATSIPRDDIRILPWVRKTLSRAARYAFNLESEFACSTDGHSTVEQELYAIPFLLLEKLMGIEFDSTAAIRNDATPDTGGGHDSLLLAGLIGADSAHKNLQTRLNETAGALTEPDYRMSRAYDLTHEILYLRLLDGDVSESRELQALIEELLAEVMPRNRDLGAELLASYWIIGGEVTPHVIDAVRKLKSHGDVEISNKGCCKARFKEQAHERLTMLLGIGLTLGLKDEVLQTADCEA